MFAIHKTIRFCLSEETSSDAGETDGTLPYITLPCAKHQKPYQTKRREFESFESYAHNPSHSE